MGIRKRVKKGKAAPPAAGDQQRQITLGVKLEAMKKARTLEKDPSSSREKLHRARLELQKMISLSMDADETICKLAAVARRVVQEREEARMTRNVLLAQVQARRNAQAMMAALASRSLAAAVFSRYGNQALLVPFGWVTMQMQQQYYGRAAGVSYCFASSLSRTPGQESFNPDTFLVDMAEGDSGVAGKKNRSGSELGLVAKQMLRLPGKKGEVVEAPVPEEEEEEEEDAEETMSDAGPTEAGDSVDGEEKCCGGGERSLAGVVSAPSKKPNDAA